VDPAIGPGDDYRVPDRRQGHTQELALYPLVFDLHARAYSGLSQQGPDVPGYCATEVVAVVGLLRGVRSVFHTRDYENYY
jgi:hypothetical protein